MIVNNFIKIINKKLVDINIMSYIYIVRLRDSKLLKPLNYE